ncbi:M23 family metallopeptidase [Spirochaetia bacterium 38H-sp]|uniref:M23 family metallopeptidase n=1 Tax=Rarispira pelagica TaxID=3141764 RepID=A0ABU9UBG7_9SPIR
MFSIAADIRANVPLAIVEATPFPVLLYAEDNFPGSFFVSIMYKNEKIVSSPMFLFPDSAYTYYAFLAVPYGYEIADKDLSIIFSADSKILIEKTVPFFTQTYRSETIELDRTLTSIREDTSKRRQYESRMLYELIVSFEDYHGGLFDTWFMPVGSGRFSSYFGDIREFVYSDGEKAYSRHSGIDIASEKGTPVILPVYGRVMMAENRIVTGNTVVVCHAPGVYSLYYHLDKIFVKKEEEIVSGTVIGTVGTTGLSTGPHLHWEVRVAGVPVSPFSLIGCSLLDIIKKVIKIKQN